MNTKNMSILWVGDAVYSTGFSKITHEVCDYLHSTLGWTVNVLGMNYYGDPHDKEYSIYPAYAPIDGCHSYGGEGRLAKLIFRLKPDVVIFLNDPWNIDGYIAEIRNSIRRLRSDGEPENEDLMSLRGQPDVLVSGDTNPVKMPCLMAYLAVDAVNQASAYLLNGLDHVITWTDFGLQELYNGGYKGSGSVVPLSTDTDLFSPKDKLESRRLCLPSTINPDSFIVGFVGRDQYRKRPDLTIQIFAEWVHENDIRDAVLYMHISPTGEQSCDIISLARFYGLSGQLVISTPPKGYGCPVTMMPHVYSSMDVLLLTSMGEGWAYCPMEALSCGVPVVANHCGGFDEWATKGVILIEPIGHGMLAPVSGLPYHTIGNVIDVDQAKAKLDLLYRDNDLRIRLGKEGREHIKQNYSSTGKPTPSRLAQEVLASMHLMCE